LANAAPQSGWDLIVVGAGTAGLPAAIFASRLGGRVLLIDASATIGGTLNIAVGQVAAGGTILQDKKGIKDSPDQHFEDVMRLSRGLANADLVRRTVDEAPATMNWLLKRGLTPFPNHPVVGDSPSLGTYSVPRYFWAPENGRAILAVLKRELAPELTSGRVVAQLETRVTELIVAGNAVRGVRASTAHGTQEFYGSNVLLSTGGYAMNPELFSRLIGGSPYVASSYPFSRGDGLELAAAAGSVIRGANLHRAGTGAILTRDSWPAQVYARFQTDPIARQPWEIWVDTAGRRFLREDEPSHYARERAIGKLNGFRYAIMFDHTIANEAPPGIPGWTREKVNSHFGAHPMFLRADSLDGLAAAAQIDGTALRQTVTDYNDGIDRGSDTLGREFRPRKIAQAPYYAIVHLGHSATSAAGVTVDRDLVVLKASGEAIQGLHAAGEILGSGAYMGSTGVPGMMLTPSLSLGRMLGMRIKAS
jgi:fumarate reductase flavoprotein subunit